MVQIWESSGGCVYVNIGKEYVMSPNEKKPWHHINGIVQIEVRADEQIDADCAFAVGGNSLEPFLSDGDFVLVKYADSINHNEVGAFWANERVRIMRMYQKDGVQKLISLNLDYPDAELSGDVKCIGRVVRQVDKSRVTKIGQHVEAIQNSPESESSASGAK